MNDPAASLISVPLQSNFDFGGGPNDDGFQYKLNVQPVIPFGLNEDWKIISRAAEVKWKWPSGLNVEHRLKGDYAWFKEKGDKP